MDFITLYSDHSGLLHTAFKKKTGLYIIGNKKYPNWVKVGGAPDLKTRLSNYRTYTPEYKDLILHAVARKKANSVRVGERKDNWKSAEKRLHDYLLENGFVKPSQSVGGTEWFYKKNAAKNAVKLMENIHFGYDGKRSDGGNLSLYKFRKNDYDTLKMQDAVDEQSYEPIRKTGRKRKINSKLSEANIPKMIKRILK